MASSPKSQKDDRRIFNLSTSDAVKSILSPIDGIRSQTVDDGFIESRVNAFYRMIGFPVVKNNLEFFSPGYDTEININSTASAEIQSIINGVVDNKKLISQQLNPRELIFKNYNKIFSFKGFESKAIALGSLFIRSFENQLGSVGPLDFDENQKQNVRERTNNLSSFYSKNTDQSKMFDDLQKKGLLISNHPLKPFIVDPRITVYPDSNIIAAPFARDLSKLQSFAGTLYKRPYIERVITLRLNNRNNATNNVNINEIIKEIKNDNRLFDRYLINISKNPEKELQNSNLSVFNNYFNILRASIDVLIKSIKEILDARQSINFQPVPDSTFGLEGDVTIDAVERDNNNKEIEDDILKMYSKISLSNFAFSSDLGSGGKVDKNGFVFSGLDDMVFSADKSVENSFQDQYKKLLNMRNSTAMYAIDALKNIEYLMGEFSGLGIIDVLAIQSALWIMDQDKLLGLIDARAFNRLKKNRPDVNTNGVTRSDDVFESLSEFETQLKGVYSLIQLYFDQVYNGKVFTSS